MLRFEIFGWGWYWSLTPGACPCRRGERDNANGDRRDAHPTNCATESGSPSTSLTAYGMPDPQDTCQEA